jgi:hypothetical protein
VRSFRRCGNRLLLPADIGTIAPGGVADGAAAAVVDGLALDHTENQMSTMFILNGLGVKSGSRGGGRAGSPRPPGTFSSSWARADRAFSSRAVLEQVWR